MSELLVIAPPGAVHSDADSAARWWFVDRHGAASDCTFDALADNVGDQPVVLVLSAADALVSRVTLAKKQARHIARVVPFLLEDQLLVAPEGQWFAWGDGEAGEYPVAAIDRAALDTLLGRCREAGVSLKSMRIDALELASEGPGLVQLGAGRTLVLASPSSALVLPDDQLPLYVGDQAPLGQLEPVLDDAGYRQALHVSTARKPAVELLHGPLRPRQRSRARNRKPLDTAWRNFSVFAAVAVLVALLLVAFQGWQYRQAADTMRARAATAYEDMFPGDRATAKLESQFQRRLQMAAGGDTASGFLGLMVPVGESLGALRERGVTPRSIQFSDRDANLVLELSAPDYDILQALQTDLESRGLAAEIANYRNQGEQVSALLRVEGS